MTNKNPYKLYQRYDGKLKDNNHRPKPCNKSLIMRLVRQDAASSANGSHGNFRCTSCSKWYNLSFGRFGKVKTFEDPSYYCADCVKLLKDKFVRM